MNVIVYLSNIMIPLLIFCIIGYGLLSKTSIFDAFIRGAADGLRVVVSILPTLIGLLIAIGILRESGCLEALGKYLAPIGERIGIPGAVLPLGLVKMISSSAATGLLTDIYKKYGTDSQEGYLASLMMCCSETIFYTISVYFLATKDKEHKPVTGMRWLLAGALLSTLAGTLASVLLSK